jgi:hypothetical protein
MALQRVAAPTMGAAMRLLVEKEADVEAKIF